MRRVLDLLQARGVRRRGRPSSASPSRRSASTSLREGRVQVRRSLPGEAPGDIIGAGAGHLSSERWPSSSTRRVTRRASLR